MDLKQGVNNSLLFLSSKLKFFCVDSLVYKLFKEVLK